MIKNLRFYSLVAALATMYSVTPRGVSAAITEECKECRWAQFFASLSDDYDYMLNNGYTPSQVCVYIEMLYGGSPFPGGAMSICEDVISYPQNEESYCSSSCESESCSTVCLDGTDMSTVCASGETCTNGCCQSSGSGSGGGGSVTPSEPSCSGSDHHYLFVRSSSTVNSAVIYNNYCGGSLSSPITESVTISQANCTSYDYNKTFRMIDWCQPSLCDGEIKESSNTIYSCQTCASGYTKVKIDDLYTYDTRSYTNNNGSWPFNRTNTVSSDEPDSAPFYVCVKCEYTGSGGWSSYDSNRVRRYVPVCSASANTYQYACKASRCATNSYTTSSLSCVSNRCSFPYTSCPSSDGHWTLCSCQWSNGAYSTDMEGNGTTCAACPTPTSIYTGTSGTTVPGTHAPSASGSANSCYVNSGTYHDTTGYWTYSSSCNYSGS